MVVVVVVVVDMAGKLTSIAEWMTRGNKRESLKEHEDPSEMITP